jgi:hypothetical protein
MSAWTMKTYREGRLVDRKNLHQFNNGISFTHPIPKVGERVRVDITPASFCAVPVEDVQYDYQNQEVHVYLIS